MQLHRHLSNLMLLCAASLAGAAQAQTTPPAAARLQAAEIAKGDPARWYQEDVTPEQRLRTLRKDIGAALEEARLACKEVPAASRAACLQQAQARYQADMAKLAPAARH